MKQCADRIALQHLINAYHRETGRGCVVFADSQTTAQLRLSGGLPILWLCLTPLNLSLAAPLAYVSTVGAHRLADLPGAWIEHRWQHLKPAALASLLLEDLSSLGGPDADTGQVLARWLRSRETLAELLDYRAADLDSLNRPEQSFIESEQALIVGHALHPTPKSREGFVGDDMLRFSPEARGQFPLHFWLVEPGSVVQGYAGISGGAATSDKLRAALLQSERLDDATVALLSRHADWQLVPFHPWQARYLMGQPLWRELADAGLAVNLGEIGWTVTPTTSVRTLAGEAPWMFKPSLSVAITNSVRVNKPRECLRGQLSCQLWQGSFGERLRREFPTLRALNDPGWIALTVNGQIVEETICILRDNPFAQRQQITCMASLCQDHPLRPESRLGRLLDTLVEREGAPPEGVAVAWFERFLDVAVLPMFGVYARYGMVFEAHQQNTLIELEDCWPARFWLRDNQGFYYVEEYAAEVLELIPELAGAADSVGPEAFVQDRFIYYFICNTVFGLVAALGASGYATEPQLLERFQHFLQAHRAVSPRLIDTLLSAPDLPFKANLLTRLHDIDELQAPLEAQSVYVRIDNPLRCVQMEVASA